MRSHGVNVRFRLAMAGKAWHAGYAAGRAGLPRQCPPLVTTDPGDISEWELGWDEAKHQEQRPAGAAI
ncbi:MAG: hypothetical protein ACRDGF_04135 [Chloroflexota bacterium]